MQAIGRKSVPVPLPISEAQEDRIRDIIDDGNVQILFQPIVDLATVRILGYEALVRGPSDSPLHSPLVLFGKAADQGCLIELETMVIEKALREFSSQRLVGKVFVNLTMSSFREAESIVGPLTELLAELSIIPESVVIELTETHPCFESDEMQKVAGILRSHGLTVALDDLGEGFAGLKRWSIVKPHYVKVDRHFIDGIHQDPIKQQFIRSVVDIAKVSDARVIAEGLEQSSDLQVLRDIGVDHVQGFLIARPSPRPIGRLTPETERSLSHQVLRRIPSDWNRSHIRSITACDLARPARTVTADTPVFEVLKAFQSASELNALPVLDREGRPVGIIRSIEFLQTASKPYFHDIYSKKNCAELMDSSPLIFDCSVELRAISEEVARLEERFLVDGFLVTREGRYVGSGKTTDLVKAVSDMQIFAAKYSNPLTMLPGNVPIDEHINYLLARGGHFVVTYWDLNAFKPYNDVYGYAAGDDVIKMTADVLGNVNDENLDFLGHIGGDDFVSVFLSEDWERRIQEALDAFAARIGGYLHKEHVETGGYDTVNRKGKVVRHDAITLAAGVLEVQDGMFTYPSQVSQAVTEAKKMAKSIGGNAYFIERRGRKQAS